MTEFLTKNRRGLYALVNVTFLLAVVLASAAHGDTGVNALYLCLLFALCSAPLLLLDRLNGRYALLAILLAFYFLFFGWLDFLTVALGAESADTAAPGGGMSAAECAMLCGAACLWIGYLVGVRLPGRKPRQTVAMDWPARTILLVGAALWVIGSLTTLYLQVYLFPEKTIAATTRGLAELTPGMTFLVMLGNLLAPLGTLILSYGYAKFRTLSWLAIALFVVAAQVVIAFVTDVRGLALMPVALVIAALILTRNKLPTTWIVASILGAGVVFPVLSAYRVVITGERGMTRTQAAENLGKVLDTVLAYRDKLSQGARGGNQTLFQRASLKENVTRAFEHTGVDVPFEEGRTLVAIPLAFIPRLVWPDKPGTATGQLFNHEFFPGGTADTYISPSNLGELYWNFGWPGMLVGLTLIGTLLGVIGQKCDLAEHVSVTRVLVLLATIYYLCWGFEGSMDVSYVSWVRSLAAIGIFHLLFARPVAAATATEVASDRSGSLSLAPVSAAIGRFPNVMR